MIKYVAVRFTNDKSVSSFHIYSKTSGNKDTIIKYVKELEKTYENHKGTQFRVMTKETADRKYKEYQEWFEKYDLARWERNAKRVKLESLRERGWIK